VAISAASEATLTIVPAQLPHVGQDGAVHLHDWQHQAHEDALKIVGVLAMQKSEMPARRHRGHESVDVVVKKLGRLRGDPGRVVGVAGVAGNEEHLRTRRGDGLARCLAAQGIAADHDDPVGAFPGETLGGGEAHT
jgi:hypothetical protein